ncbi:SDR family NAD(P)-dependent oxidoreductase [Paenibacillus marinisediminis]
MAWKEKKVLITGAGGGIGRTLAVTYAQHGAEVIVIDKDQAGLQETSDLIRNRGGSVESYVVDLSKAAEIEQLFRILDERNDRLDVLINNAGLGITKSPYELTVEDWDYVLGTNLRGTFLCSRLAAGIMKRHGGGAIVNIASTRALMSEPNSEAYAASKGGILSLTHALAASLGEDGITVNAISPGWIETGNYADLRAIDHTQHPSQRVGKPEDIARACMYLTNADNDFVTGINLVVDGGMTRKMIYVE